MAGLVEPVEVAGRTAPSRVVFGPHETNLGRGRAVSDRHVAYYEARAAGGAGILVTETASVHPSDWPYERAPLAAECGPGWSSVAAACHPYGTVVLAGLGHCGSQGSSANSQSVMWAPSRVADVVSREMPVAMEQSDIDELVAGFADAARRAMVSGLHGVEIDAGYCSLLRQFHSGLTNLRQDPYGSDRLRLTTEVLGAVRAALDGSGILSLRLCCDELAPWAGVTPDQAGDHVAALAGLVDLIVVVRGGPFSTSAYRPDAHTEAGFNLGLCRQMRAAAAGRVPIVLQGSVVDLTMAESALNDGTADLVEMTRAQIAEPRLVGSGPSGRRFAGAALHPLQSGLPRPGQPQSGRELRGGAPQRLRDHRTGGGRNRPGPTGGPDRGRRYRRARVRPGVVGPGAPRAGGGAVRPGRRRPAGSGGGPGP